MRSVLWMVVGVVSVASPAWAARVALEKGTGKLIEYQSAARPGTLLQNAVAAGYDSAQVEEREVTPDEWKVIEEQWIVQPAKDEQERNKDVEIPLSEFGGAVGAMAGAASLVIVTRKKKEPA